MQHTHKISVGAISRTVGYLANDVNLAIRKLCRNIPAVLVLAGLLGASAVAQAGTMVVRLYDHHNSSGTSNTPAMKAVHHNEGGAFDLKVSNPSSTQFMGPGSGTSSTGILSFFTEMTEFIHNGPTNLATIPLANTRAQVSGSNINGVGATSAMLIEELWGKNVNPVVNPPAGLVTSQAAGAFQLAIWKLEHAGSDAYGMPGSVNFGKEYADGSAHQPGDASALGAASNWINSLSHNPSSGESADLAALSGAHFQDQVCQIVTPEPSSNLIWLVVAAIGIYPIMRRRSNAA